MLAARLAREAVQFLRISPGFFSFMSSNLSGKNILITGGTSRLGECFVRGALKSGARVYFTWTQASAKAAELHALGAEGFSLDLSDMRKIQHFADLLNERVQKLDAVIHNAAAVSDKLLRDMEEEDWDRVLNVDLKAPFYLTQKILPLVLKAAPSKIFMLISRAASLGAYGAANYAAAKAGLAVLVKSLAEELGPSGVLVNAVNPGFMLSGMTKNLAEPYLQKNRDASPLGKYSNPEEVARFLIYLCSDEMTQVTGQVFHYESRRMPF